MKRFTIKITDVFVATNRPQVVLEAEQFNVEVTNNETGIVTLHLVTATDSNAVAFYLFSGAPAGDLNRIPQPLTKTFFTKELDQ